MMDYGKSERAHGEERQVLIGEPTLDRMQGLSKIFEDATRGFARTLSKSAEGVRVSVDCVIAMRVGDLEEVIKESLRSIVFQMTGLNSVAVLAVDNAFRLIAMELLLGSSVVEDSIDGAPTRLEERVIRYAAEQFASSVASAFDSLVTIKFEPYEGKLEAGAAALGAKSAVTVFVRARIDYHDRSGSLLFALPRMALDPFRNQLSKLVGPGGEAKDEKWSVGLYSNIVQTEVRADVKLEARGFTLGDIASLEIGDILKLPIKPVDPIRIELEGRTLFWCNFRTKRREIHCAS